MKMQMQNSSVSLKKKFKNLENYYARRALKFAKVISYYKKCIPLMNGVFAQGKKTIPRTETDWCRYFVRMVCAIVDTVCTKSTAIVFLNLYVKKNILTSHFTYEFTKNNV